MIITPSYNDTIKLHTSIRSDHDTIMMLVLLLLLCCSCSESFSLDRRRTLAAFAVAAFHVVVAGPVAVVLATRHRFWAEPAPDTVTVSQRIRSGARCWKTIAFPEPLAARSCKDVEIHARSCSALSSRGKRRIQPCTRPNLRLCFFLVGRS